MASTIARRRGFAELVLALARLLPHQAARSVSRRPERPSPSATDGVGDVSRGDIEWELYRPLLGVSHPARRAGRRGH